MVSTSEVSISVTVDSNERLPEICAELSKIADVKLEGSKALICMVGEDIRGRSGIAGRVFSAIRHVNMRMISQGASEINMSFMIEGRMWRRRSGHCTRSSSPILIRPFSTLRPGSRSQA